MIWNFQKVKKQPGRIQTIAELLMRCLQGVFGIIIWLDFSNFCAIFFNSFIFMHAKTYSCRITWRVSDPSSFQLWAQLPCRSGKSVQTAHQRWLTWNGLSIFTPIYVHCLSTVSWNTRCWVLIKRVTISSCWNKSVFIYFWVRITFILKDHCAKIPTRCMFFSLQ